MDARKRYAEWLLKRVPGGQREDREERARLREGESSYRPGIMQTTQQLDRGLPPVI